MVNRRPRRAFGSFKSTEDTVSSNSIFTPDASDLAFSNDVDDCKKDNVALRVECSYL